jgi:hypothetical protein
MAHAMEVAIPRASQFILNDIGQQKYTDATLLQNNFFTLLHSPGSQPMLSVGVYPPLVDDTGRVKKIVNL